MKTKLSLILATLLSMIGSAHAADLDAPATKPVTVRTEIERGLDAASRLPMDNLVRYGELLDSILSINKQKNTDTDGFKFGIYYGAWHHFWRLASVDLRDPRTQQLAQSQAHFYYLLADVFAKKLQLDPDQIQKLSYQYVPGEETLFPEIVKSKRFKGSYLAGRKQEPSTEITGAEKKP